MRSVTVKTSATYEVLIGSGLLQKAGEAVKKVISPCKAAIVTDSTVVHLYEETVRKSLTEAGFSVLQSQSAEHKEQPQASCLLSG